MACPGFSKRARWELNPGPFAETDYETSALSIRLMSSLQNFPSLPRLTDLKPHPVPDQMVQQEVRSHAFGCIRLRAMRERKQMQPTTWSGTCWLLETVRPVQFALLDTRAGEGVWDHSNEAAKGTGSFAKNSLA